MAGAPPFPLFVIAFCINGFGLGLQDAQINGFITRLPNAGSRMSIAHAIYGLGALVSPLIATQFARSTFEHWNLHYVCSVAIMAANSATLGYVFRLKRDDDLFAICNYVPQPQAHFVAPVVVTDSTTEVCFCFDRSDAVHKMSR
jgi:fucose permease